MQAAEQAGTETSKPAAPTAGEEAEDEEMPAAPGDDGAAADQADGDLQTPAAEDGAVDAEPGEAGEENEAAAEEETAADEEPTAEEEDDDRHHRSRRDRQD